MQNPASELRRISLLRTRLNKAEADVSICSRKRYASWQMHLLAFSVTITPWRRTRRRLSWQARLRLMVHHGRIRWYNPKLKDFEWRRVPRSDEEALKLLRGAPHSPTCKETYGEWRQLGASITVALLRAGEAALRREEEDGR